MDAGSSTQTQTEQPKQDPMIAEAMRLNAIGLERDGKKPDATGAKPEAATSEAKAGDAKAGQAEEGQPREGGKFAKKPETVAKEEAAKMERARQALRRARYPQEALDGLSSEQVLNLGTKFADEQADQDRKSSSLGKKSKESRVAEPDKGQPPKGTDNLPVIDTKALSEKFALDEDDAREIESWGRELVKPLTAALSEAEKASAESALERYELAFELGVSSLLPQYPEIESYRDQVREKYDEYAESGAYDGYPIKEAARLCMKDAVEFVCKPQIDARKAKVAEEQAKAKAKGQPSTGSRQGDGALKQPDPWMATAELLNSGMSWREAQARVYGN